MNHVDVDRFIAQLRAGRSMRVPFSTTLGPDTRADENVLRADAAGGFELRTVFSEFWAGHGWSVPQTEVETRTEDQVRQALAACLAADCTLLP